MASPNRFTATGIGYGAQFDHIILDANSKDNSLENCAAVCPQCHKFKSRHYDTPLAAKTLRQQDKNRGIKRQSKWQTKFKKKVNGRV